MGKANHRKGFTPAEIGERAARLNGAVSDDLNPKFIFALTHTSLLCKAVREELDLHLLAREELASRGVDEYGAWLGLKKKGGF